MTGNIIKAALLLTLSIHAVSAAGEEMLQPNNPPHQGAQEHPIHQENPEFTQMNQVSQERRAYLSTFGGFQGMDQETNQIVGVYLPERIIDQAVYNPNTHKIYVANNDENKIQILNAQTHMDDGEISQDVLGSDGVYCMALDPVNNVLYITNGAQIGSIDLNSNTSLAPVPTELTKISHIDFNPRTNALYVIGHNNAQNTDFLCEISKISEGIQEIKTLNLNALQGLTVVTPESEDLYYLTGMAVDSESSKIYIAGYDKEYGILVVNARDLRIEGTIRINGIATSIVGRNPMTGHLYVKNKRLSEKKIYIIDPATQQIVDTIEGLPDYAHSILFTPPPKQFSNIKSARNNAG